MVDMQRPPGGSCQGDRGPLGGRDRPVIGNHLDIVKLLTLYPLAARCRDHRRQYPGCAACKTYRRSVTRRRERLRVYGVHVGYVDPTATRRHVAYLARRGASRREIAAAAGVNKGAVVALMLGKGRVLADNERAILAVRWENLRTEHVHLAGTQRKLQALYTLGYDIPAMRRHGLAANDKTIYRWLTDSLDYPDRGEIRRIARSDAALVDALYRKLSLTPSYAIYADRARHLAEKRGWLDPCAWTFVDIDDPDAQPLPTPQPVPEEPDLRDAPDLEVRVAAMKRDGKSHADIAAALGVTREDIDRVSERIRRRLRYARKIAKKEGRPVRAIRAS